MKTPFVYFEFFIMGFQIHLPLTNNYSRASSQVYLPTYLSYIYSRTQHIPIKGVASWKNISTDQKILEDRLFNSLPFCFQVSDTVVVHAPRLVLQSKIKHDFTKILKIADVHTLYQEKPLFLLVIVLMQTDLWHNRHLSTI